MFKNVFSSGAELRIGETTIRYLSVAELEFALSGRTGLPAEKTVSLLQLSEEELLAEANGIRAVEKQLSEVLSRAIAGNTAVGAFLKEMELSLVSQDYDWRAIMGALNRLDASFEEYKRVALVKYLQYLAARQSVVSALYSDRHREVPDGPLDLELDGENDEAVRETFIFGVGEVPDDKESISRDFERLPRGETVSIHVRELQRLDLKLGKNRFRIDCAGTLVLVDETQGREFPIHQGKNVVGRDRRADIVLDGRYGDISRRHLIIESDGELVSLTDISSLGTSLPSEYLARISHRDDSPPAPTP